MEMKVLNEIVKNVEKIGEKEFILLKNMIKKGKKIFVIGAGRSGFIGRCFAMRLRHLGIESYFVGETITPPIRRGDLAIFISCSGERKTLNHLAEICKKEKAKILCLTSQKESPLSKISDEKIIIEKGKSVQFGNSLFEQTVFVFLEEFIEYYRKSENISRSFMKKQHANLE